MSTHLVLPRKLRPKRFAGLLGQEALAQTLKQAVHSQKTAHALLFSGSQGVGKTSAARILAKALNCQKPEEGEPCNACSSCQEVEQGASPDVIEIDAASNRGVDNIRDIRENVRFLPVRLQYKVYIIDEAHMLTQEAFNALLKTLEEPPARVKFVLATTDPQKIPATILSRCQCFNFMRMPLERLTTHLTEVAQKEGLNLPCKVIELVASRSGGGMRDALMSLERAAAFVDSSVDEDQMMQALGFSGANEAQDILQAVFQKDAAAALRLSSQALEYGMRPELLLENLVKTTSVLSTQVALGGQERPGAIEKLAPELIALAPALSVLQQLFYLLLETEQLLKWSDHRNICLDMCLLQACNLENLQGIPELLQAATHLGNNPPPSTQQRPDPPPSAPTRDSRTSRQKVQALAQQAKSFSTNQASAKPMATVPSMGSKSASKKNPSHAPNPATRGTTPSSTDFVAKRDPLPPMEAYETKENSPNTPAAGRNAHPPPTTRADGNTVDFVAKRDPLPPIEAYETKENSPNTPAAGKNAHPPPTTRADGNTVDFVAKRDPLPPMEAYETKENSPNTPAAGKNTHPPPTTRADGNVDNAVKEWTAPSERTHPTQMQEGIFCNDSRWIALVDLVRQNKHRGLIMRLRNAEVRTLNANQGEAVFQARLGALSPEEEALVQGYAQQVFGAGFGLQLRHAKPTEEIRNQHTLSVQQNLQKEQQRKALEEHAKNDPQIKALQRFFPGATVLHVKLPV